MLIVVAAVKGARVAKDKVNASKMKAQGEGMLLDDAVNSTGSDDAEEEVVWRLPE